MELRLPKPGPYVVAVSGGIDSTCLLDILAKQPGLRLTVAHLDHGIRTNSSSDAEFVSSLASSYKLPFICQKANLGPQASEASAREVRYQFLENTLNQTKSKAIITAHHQDDRIETLIINIIRGTGRLGISSIGESSKIKRPLLRVSKAELKRYATSNNLIWREDNTNQDDKYLRNYVRLRILPRLKPADKQKLLELMDKQVALNQEIDLIITPLLQQSDKKILSLKTLNVATYAESQELIAAWLRINNLLNFDRKTVERLTLAAKTKRPGVKVDVYNKSQVWVGKDFLALDIAER